jgi:hypothetical protein
MEHAVPNNKFPPKPFIPQNNKEKKPFQKEWTRRDRLDDDDTRELRRKNIFFSCKEPWEPGHKCMGKGKVHYIEVLSYSDGEEEAGQAQDNEHDSPVVEHPHEEVKSGTISTLFGVPRFHNFRVCGVLQVQHVTVLINVGEIHNFIN